MLWSHSLVRACWRGALIVLASAILLLATLAGPRVSTALQGQVSVSVDVSGGGQLLDTRLTTNLTTPGSLQKASGAQALLAAWAPPLVRLHVGADTGGTPLLPAGLRRGDWNLGPLDAMVAAVRAYGGEPMINVRYAPAWMWTCAAPFSQSSDGMGTLRDKTFAEFAEYVARLVSWYNRGGFVDENGVTRQSNYRDAVHYWELWNEPDLSGETPCHPTEPANPDSPALTPEQYVAMWNVVSARMLAVDPTLKLIGPVTSSPLSEYVQPLVRRSQRPPDILSYHIYGGYDNAQTDEQLFRGLDDTVRAVDPRAGRPIWVTELNVNSAFESEDPNGRPAGPLGIAWGASAFRQLALAEVKLMHQFEFLATPQFGLVDDTTGAPRPPYWRDLLLSRAFPSGSVVLPSTTAQAGIEVLAARRPDHGISILVINRQVPNARDSRGRGVPSQTVVTLSAAWPAAGALTVLDATVNSAEPRPQNLPPGREFSIAFAGYGMALIDLPPVAPTPSPTPVPPLAPPTVAPAPTPTTGPSMPAAASNAPSLAHDSRYFPETRFRVDDDVIWSYFQARGGVSVLGYPVSRNMFLLGCKAQIFQRHIVQQCGGQAPGLMNLLDPDVFPYTRVNGSTFPDVDHDLKENTPRASDPDYADKVLDFVRMNAPDSFDGTRVNFGSTFFSQISPELGGVDDPGTLGLLNLELLGAPISHPQRDVANSDFIYQRFQRGILHHDATTGITSSVLLADYVKAILIGQGLPSDLEHQAQTSRFYQQYCPGGANWTCRPDDLPATDLTFAFEEG